jgi:hypothetical protein
MAAGAPGGHCCQPPYAAERKDPAMRITVLSGALLLATAALALPATSASAAASSPTAIAAKKKCRTGFVKKKHKCVKVKKCKTGYARKVVHHKRVCVRKPQPNVAPTPPTAPATTPPAPTPGTPAGPAWSDGRWRGTYSDSSLDLLFNVVGNRLYTGGFDSFFVDASCDGGGIDPANVAPVEATISPGGDFSGSGTYSPGFGQQIPWQVSGHISGTSITGGTFTVGPYTDFYGGTCNGTTHFTGRWFGAYTF